MSVFFVIRFWLKLSWAGISRGCVVSSVHLIRGRYSPFVPLLQMLPLIIWLKGGLPDFSIVEIHFPFVNSMRFIDNLTLCDCSRPPRSFTDVLASSGHTSPLNMYRILDFKVSWINLFFLLCGCVSIYILVYLH